MRIVQTKFRHHRNLTRINTVCFVGISMQISIKVKISQEIPKTKTGLLQISRMDKSIIQQRDNIQPTHSVWIEMVNLLQFTTVIKESLRAKLGRLIP